MFDEEMELSEIDKFLISAIRYIRDMTVIKQYAEMSEESRRKYRERLAIMVCKTFSPRKNYDISKDEIRELVNNSLEYLEHEYKQSVIANET